MFYTTRQGTYKTLDAPSGKNKIELAFDWLSNAFRFRTVEPAFRINEIEHAGNKYQYLTIEFDMPEVWEQAKVDALIKYYKDAFLK